MGDLVAGTVARNPAIPRGGILRKKKSERGGTVNTTGGTGEIDVNASAEWRLQKEKSKAIRGWRIALRKKSRRKEAKRKAVKPFALG